MSISITVWDYERYSVDELRDQFIVSFLGQEVVTFPVLKSDWDNEEILERFVEEFFAPVRKVMNCE